MNKNIIVCNLEIFYRDIPSKTYERGKILCTALRGGDWRYPTFEELSYIYDLHRLGILSLKEGNYWSSEIMFKSINKYSKTINFTTGKTEYSLGSYTNNIRPVRSI